MLPIEDPQDMALMKLILSFHPSKGSSVDGSSVKIGKFKDGWAFYLEGSEVNNEDDGENHEKVK